MKSSSLLTALFIFFSLLSFSLPVLTMAVEDTPGKDGYHVIIPCDGKSKATGATECNFRDFMTQLNRIINLLLYLAGILAIISFIYAGFLLLFSGGNESALKDAKDIFLKVLTGIVLAFLAWTIVHFLLTAFGVSSDYLLLQS